MINLSNGNSKTKTCFYEGTILITCGDSIGSTTTVDPLKTTPTPTTTQPEADIPLNPQSTIYFYSFSFNMIGIQIKTSRNGPALINGKSIFGLENAIRNVWWETTTYDSNVKNLFSYLDK